jgi:hypothetical protein
MKRLHLALGLADVDSSADDHSQCLGSRPDLLIPGKDALWHTAAVNLLIWHGGHEESGARRRHGSGDVVRRADAIQG